MKASRIPLSASESTGFQNHRDRIYELLVGRIRRGELEQHERLVDTSLAAELGVSRMPAREALMRMAHEGYLEATTRGFMLPRLSRAEILEVFDIRRLLEPRAAAHAAQALTDQQLEEMGRALAEAKAAAQLGNVEMLFRASERFRNGWLSAVPNNTLKNMIQRYMTQVQVVRMMTFRDPNIHPVIVTGNSRLFEAFTNRDSVAAADSMLRFIFEGEVAYLGAMADKNERPQSKRLAKSA